MFVSFTLRGHGSGRAHNATQHHFANYLCLVCPREDSNLHDLAITRP
jgi:hypothetical protein